MVSKGALLLSLLLLLFLFGLQSVLLSFGFLQPEQMILRTLNLLPFIFTVGELFLYVYS